MAIALRLFPFDSITSGYSSYANSDCYSTANDTIILGNWQSKSKLVAAKAILKNDTCYQIKDFLNDPNYFFDTNGGTSYLGFKIGMKTTDAAAARQTVAAVLSNTNTTPSPFSLSGELKLSHFLNENITSLQGNNGNVFYFTSGNSSLITDRIVEKANASDSSGNGLILKIWPSTDAAPYAKFTNLSGSGLFIGYYSKIKTITLPSQSTYVGNSIKLTPTIQTINGRTNYYNNFTWSSSNTSVVTVDSSGNVITISQGTAIITCSAKDNSGASGSCTITVTNLIEFDKTEVVLYENVRNKDWSDFTQETLIINFSPNYTGNKDLIWSSSNDSIAAVDSYGTVTAVEGQHGNVTIRATLSSNELIYTECQVIIKSDVPGVELDFTSPIELTIGEKRSFYAYSTPKEFLSDSGVDWQYIEGASRDIVKVTPYNLFTSDPVEIEALKEGTTTFNIWSRELETFPGNMYFKQVIVNVKAVALPDDPKPDILPETNSAQLFYKFYNSSTKEWKTIIPIIKEVTS